MIQKYFQFFVHCLNIHTPPRWRWWSSPGTAKIKSDLNYEKKIFFLLCLWGVLYFWTKEGGWKLKFTDKWAELASQVIGYSQFIKSCDENKIKMLLKEDPLFIDRTLPYATAFWMETEFLKKISPLKKDWNARYVRWQKVPSWIWILRFFIKDDDSLL